MNLPTPKVSICLPVFNGERYVGQAIASILAQSFEDFELVLSDNASTDGTAEVCRVAAARDARVRYARADVNRGLAWNFNRAFALARGTYLMWIGHDDVMAPEYIHRCVETIEEDHGVVLCFANTNYIDERGQMIQRADLQNGAALDKPVWRFHNILFTAMCDPIFGLMKRDVLKQTRLHGPFADSDRVLLAEMALRGRFALIPDYLFSRRMHSQRTTVRHQDRWARTLIFDPAKKGKIFFPLLLEVQAFLSAIGRARLLLKERLRCYQLLARWLWQERSGLLQHG